MSIRAPANLASEEVPNQKALRCDLRGKLQKHSCYASTEVKRSLCEDGTASVFQGKGRRGYSLFLHLHVVFLIVLCQVGLAGILRVWVKRGEKRAVTIRFTESASRQCS